MYGINEKVYENLIQYFQNTEEINGVILFGSRAKGTARKNSDIDICIDASNERRGTIVEHIHDLVGIYTCDILFKDSLNDEIRKQIERDGIEIYSNVKLKSLQNHILELENELLKPETRCLSEKISQLLAQDFFEFCSSGKEYHYSVGDVFDNEEDAYQINWEIKEFQLKKVADNCVLATYKLIKHSELDDSKKQSLRSSIWKLSDNMWKMVFHQGTNY